MRWVYLGAAVLWGTTAVRVAFYDYQLVYWEQVVSSLFFAMYSLEWFVKDSLRGYRNV